MELYHFITLITLLKLFGLVNILLFVFSLLMIRHINKKYLQDDKKYKLYNKIKIDTKNKYKNIVSKSNENKVTSKIVIVIKESYNFANRYFKLVFNEVTFMFSDLFKELLVTNVKTTQNIPIAQNADKYLNIFHDFNKAIIQFNKTNDLINKNITSNKFKENKNNLNNKKDNLLSNLKIQNDFSSSIQEEHMKILDDEITSIKC